MTDVEEAFEAMHMDLAGVARIFLSTWPFIRAELKHFAALLALTLGMIGFGTAVAFLGFDVLWDSVGGAEPLSATQASVMWLPPSGYVDVEQLAEDARITVLARFLILTIVIVVATTSARIAIAMYKLWILQRVNQNLRATMVANAEELSLRFHSGSAAGDAIYRVFQDSAMVTAVVDNAVVVPVIGFSTLAVQMAVASLFSPWFGFLLLLAVGTLVAVVGWFTPRLRASSIGARQASANLFTRVQETFQGIQAIKAYNHEERNAAAFTAESTVAIDTAFDLRRSLAMIKVISSYLLVLVLFATDYIATAFVLQGDPVFGASLLVLFGLSVTSWTVAAHQARRGGVEAFTRTLEELLKVWCLAQDMAMGLGRALWLLNLKPEVIEPPDPKPFPDVNQGVRFRDVHFRYAPDVPVLNGIDLDAGVSQVIAVVGQSGSGKSTMMSLLLRLFDPDEGAITIDGVDVRNVRKADLRREVAIALQENVLFPVSIMDNLKYAAADASDAEVEGAVAVACADFIRGLPDGYETVLGVGGALLSTGQKQRLSIARALVRDTRILILDEPTASLDAQTEHRVLANLKVWAAGRVVFIVTHRLATIRNADRIAFLRDGIVSETGTHDELMATHGDYHQFVISDGEEAV